MAPINQSAPTKIVGKIMRSDAMKTTHPSLESTIVGIDVLYVIDLADDPNARCKIDWTMRDSDFPCSSAQCLSAVGTKNDIACHKRFERSADVHFVGFLQDKIGGTPRSVTTNQHRDLFVRQTAFRCLSPTFARRTSHALFLAFERFKEKRFIRFGDTNQTQGLLVIRQCEKTMAPAKSRVAMHFTDFGAFANALSFGHLLRIVQPLVLVTQTSQWCSCQRIKRSLAGGATVTLQSRSRTPSRDMVMTALGTHRCHQRATFNQGIDGLYVRNLLQTFRQQRSLMWRQFLKISRQNLKFFSFHHRTYLTDSYRISIGHHLTVT